MTTKDSSGASLRRRLVCIVATTQARAEQYIDAFSLRERHPDIRRVSVTELYRCDRVTATIYVTDEFIRCAAADERERLRLYFELHPLTNHTTLSLPPPAQDYRYNPSPTKPDGFIHLSPCWRRVTDTQRPSTQLAWIVAEGGEPAIALVRGDDVYIDGERCSIHDVSYYMECPRPAAPTDREMEYADTETGLDKARKIVQPCPHCGSAHDVCVEVRSNMGEDFYIGVQCTSRGCYGLGWIPMEFNKWQSLKRGK